MRIQVLDLTRSGSQTSLEMFPELWLNPAVSDSSLCVLNKSPSSVCFVSSRPPPSSSVSCRQPPGLGGTAGPRRRAAEPERHAGNSLSVSVRVSIDGEGGREDYHYCSPK